MAPTRKHGHNAQRDRRRALGRAITEKLREDLDDLDAPPLPGPAPMVAGLWTNADAEHEADAELETDDTDDPTTKNTSTDDDSIDPAESTALLDRRKRGFVLSDLIGSRSPTVLIRLVRDGTQLQARVLVPSTPKTADALAELEALVLHCFAPGRKIHSRPEQDELLGTRAAAPQRRLLLLSRLAVRGDEEIEVPGKWIFTPNDRVAGRYAGKFATLPDGLPFSIGLLLEDGRGTERTDPTRSARQFPELPDAVQLQVLLRALDIERATGTAAPNSSTKANVVTFRKYLYDAVRELKLGVDKPTDQQVKNLKERLDMNQVGHLFPNTKTRQQAYEAARVTNSDLGAS